MSQEKKKGNPWIEAFRLRTLPLSVSGILAGSALAFRVDEFRMNVFIPALLTTILLQILSNLANDYGDALKGTDGEHRIGPERMVQSGRISVVQMKFAIWITAIAAFISGLTLLYNAFGLEQIPLLLTFLLIGLVAIWSAIKYTVGKNAYGYVGLGDLFVLLFFGLVSVSGTYFLYTKEFSISAFFQSMSIGLLATGVLHLNNMRDRESDILSGKNTLAVKLGGKNSTTYFSILLISAMIFSIADNALTTLHLSEQLQLVIFIPLIILILKVKKVKQAKDYNNFLKPLALSTFVYSLLLFLAYSL